MPKTKKKASRTVRMKNENGEDVIVTQTFNIEEFKTAFTQWKNECKSLTAEEMKVKGIKSGNLFDFIKKHGIEHRPQAVNEVSEEEGIGKLLKEINEALKDTSLLTEDFKDSITEIREKLEDIKDTDADPRNIPFTVPIYRRVNKKTGQYDKKKHTKRWYGHYRVKDYNNYRNLKAKIFDNKEYEETISPVSDSWATTKENESKPPMWQALFSTTEDSGDKVKEGLLAVLLKAEDMIDGTEIEHIKLVLRGVARGGLAKELYEIEAIRTQVTSLLGTTTNLGKGVNPQTGNIKDSAIQNLFANRLSFRAKGPTGSKEIKDIFGVDKLVLGQIKGYSLNITRGMVKNLFILTRKCKRRSPKGPVYLDGYVSPAEKKKKKKDKGVKKSWLQIIGNTY